MGKHSALENFPHPGGTITYWCGVCSAEPAERDIEVELNDMWVPLKVGNECLTKLGGTDYDR